jgi:hypothetical protein
MGGGASRDAQPYVRGADANQARLYRCAASAFVVCHGFCVLALGRTAFSPSDATRNGSQLWRSRKSGLNPCPGLSLTTIAADD